ncbi:hypothetical protein [Limnohabitans sp.]|uniref:hypothetical protein n=1 Tax=Limnohabitans sp. TaxID=1907725 RepID=UPI0025C2DCC8|nr:hypothetical protein [Limnohabitans sp.]
MNSMKRKLISTLTCAWMATSITSLQAQSFTPAVIFDMGGKHDKSFNQSAFDGAERFKKDFNVNYLEAEVTQAPCVRLVVASIEPRTWGRR